MRDAKFQIERVQAQPAAPRAVEKSIFPASLCPRRSR